MATTIMKNMDKKKEKKVREGEGGTGEGLEGGTGVGVPTTVVLVVPRDDDEGERAEKTTTASVSSACSSSRCRPLRECCESSESSSRAPTVATGLSSCSSSSCCCCRLRSSSPATNENGSSSSSNNNNNNRKRSGKKKRYGKRRKVIPADPAAARSMFQDLVEDEDWEAVSDALENRPDLISGASSAAPFRMVCFGQNVRCTALHLVLSRRSVPVSVVRAVSNADPSSMMRGDSGAGRLPIHVALWRRASPEVVRYLCEQSPESLRVPDAADGNLPLHSAAEYDSDPGDYQSLQAVMDAYPQALRQRNRTKGQLPLHVFCGRLYHASSSSSEDQLKAGQQGKSQDAAKSHPRCAGEVVEHMLLYYPEAAETADKHAGRLPIHVHCDQLHPQRDVVDALLQHDKTLLTRDELGRQIPLSVLKRWHGKRLEVHRQERQHGDGSSGSCFKDLMSMMEKRTRKVRTKQYLRAMRGIFSLSSFKTKQ